MTHPFRDLFQHHFGRATADRLDPRVAHHPLDCSLAQIASAAMELSQTVEEVNRMAEGLARIAEQLAATLAQFRTTADS